MSKVPERKPVSSSLGKLYIGPDTAFGSIEIVENNRTMFNRRNFNATLCQLHKIFQESFLTNAKSTSRNYVRVYLILRKIRSP